MTGKSRAERAAALERWADSVNPEDLTTADTESLRLIAELAERRDEIDDEPSKPSERLVVRTDPGPRSAPCSASPNKRHNASTVRSPLPANPPRVGCPR